MITLKNKKKKVLLKKFVNIWVVCSSPVNVKVCRMVALILSDQCHGRVVKIGAEITPKV
jgi:hypothetical protein